MDNLTRKACNPYQQLFFQNERSILYISSSLYKDISEDCKYFEHLCHFQDREALLDW